MCSLSLCPILTEAAAPMALMLDLHKRNSLADKTLKNQWLNLSITKYKKFLNPILPTRTILLSGQLFLFATPLWTLVSLPPTTAHQMVPATRNSPLNPVIASLVDAVPIQDVEDLLVKKKISVVRSG